ncbi:hypothetical protein BJV78DRAFT_1158485 [Lactifluus subvellereus]|nr:hypothetical protein BJV78DRAFT_1158485 [Lactifluus subvellereus]
MYETSLTVTSNFVPSALEIAAFFCGTVSISSLNHYPWCGHCALQGLAITLSTFSTAPPVVSVPAWFIGLLPYPYSTMSPDVLKTFAELKAANEIVTGSRTGSSMPCAQIKVTGEVARCIAHGSDNLVRWCAPRGAMTMCAVWRRRVPLDDRDDDRKLVPGAICGPAACTSEMDVELSLVKEASHFSLAPWCMCIAPRRRGARAGRRGTSTRWVFDSGAVHGEGIGDISDFEKCISGCAGLHL